MVAKFLIIALFVGSACAATWMGNTPMKPKEFKDKEGCYVQEINDVIPSGSTITPIGYCYRIECGGNMMYYASCGIAYSSDPRCHRIETDLTKPYPDCCPRYKCDSENDITKEETQ